ncbi:hypothetical protein NC981_21510 [Leptolyngbya sp. DQ-M1]|uniref:hypothetical protein n=1 Tax=Leptolyngbya sp. DQ-M1 TaxID=2933920 RepID=UPI003299A139
MAQQANPETLVLEDLFINSNSSTLIDYQLMQEYVGFDVREKRHLMRTVKRRLWNLHKITISPLRDRGYYIH